MVWRGVIGVLIGSLLTTGWLAAAPPTVPVDSLQQLVSQLDSADYPQREAATAYLKEHLAETIPDLVPHLAESSLEVITRVMYLLSEAYVSEERTQANAASNALETLLASKNPAIRLRAAAVFSQHGLLRETRAIEEIVALGGSIRYLSDSAFPAWPRPQARRPGNAPVVTSVVLGRGWKGGDEGLKYLRRISTLNAVYRDKKANVSPEGLAELRYQIPHLSIQVRGGRLGIQSDSQGTECRIGMVEEGSAAEFSGLRSQDVVLQCQEHRIREFSDLIDALLETDPGDCVELKIQRGFQLLSIHVELSGW